MASRNITLDKVEVAVCALLLLAMVVTFGQTVCHEFVNFDDNEYVFENSYVSRGLTASGIVWAFTQGEQANWIPFTWLSLMIDCQLYDLHAGGHHLTNVLLHTATAMLLFLVLRRMTGRLWPSAFAAALFAVHPLRAESVAWVTERKDVLSGLCFMLTLGAYLGYVRHQFSWARYALLLVVFALGLMAKPMLVTLPFVLFLLDYWPFHRLALAWRIVIEKLPLIVLAAASCTVTFWAQRGAMLPQDRLPVAGRMVNALVSYAAYLVQFFYPAGLAAFYPHSGPHLSSTHVVVAAVVLAGVSVGTLACRQRCPYALVGWLWYVGMLVPVVGLVQVGSQAMADRYTYLPQIGLGIALAWGTADICRAWPSRRWACGLASASLLAALMGCAFRQTSFWCDSETLWTRALAVTSHNAMAQNGLGDALASDGRLEEGTEHFRRAVAISPYVVMFRMNLGAACLEAGQSQQAMEQFRQALALDADCAERTTAWARSLPAAAGSTRRRPISGGHSTSILTIPTPAMIWARFS